MFEPGEVKMIGFDYLNASELQEIQRNLEMLYGTPAGTCPGDRNFGLDQNFDSYPANVAQNLFALEVIEKTEIYEPRVEVKEIEYSSSESGNMTPKITIGPREDEMEEDEDEAEG